MLDRRSLLRTFSALAGCVAAGGSPAAFAAARKGWARPAAPADVALAQLRSRALGAGLPASRSAVPVAAGADYDVILPQLVDLIASMEDQGTASRGLHSALDDATELLGALTEAERSPFNGELSRSLTVYRYEDLRDSYLALYDACSFRPQRKHIIDWHVATLTRPANKRQYEAVAKRVQTPWYFVGIIHSLEAGYNFKSHLHNGDPLRARTWQVPAGRPAEWNPPTDWASSASDALAMKHYDKQPDWSLAQMLFRFESYNGFGYRARKVPSPYLWSFSDQYAKGKYVKDGKWDPQAVSRQCGAAILVKALIASGEVAAPERT
jgi:lysozyme family protein